MRAPGFWSDPRSPVATLLSPLGMIYGAATRRRVAARPRYAPPVAVICVGNVTAGGSGKTPVVLALAARAAERGIAAHCLLRGYGGREDGPLRVDPDRHGAATVGDEALLLAAVAPAWIARDRAAGAQAAVAAGARMLIMDDGMQNPAVVKDYTLLVIDGGYGFGNSRLIPAGPLREPVWAGASRSQACVMIGADITGAARFLPNAHHMFHARMAAKPHELKDRTMIAFAGIGRPEKFRDTLLAEGVRLAGWHPLADHQAISPAFLELLAAEGSRGDAGLVTTRKDWVRLPPEWRDRVAVLDVDLAPEDPAMADTIIDAGLARFLARDEAAMHRSDT